MARPCRLSPEQQAELRREALVARADSPHRGYGRARGAVGRNTTQALCDLVRERYGVRLSVRGMQAQLHRLGLRYQPQAQGGRWREATG
jgi:transposase